MMYISIVSVSSAMQTVNHQNYLLTFFLTNHSDVPCPNDGSGSLNILVDKSPQELETNCINFANLELTV